MEEELRKQAILRHVIGGEVPKAIYTEISRSKKWFFQVVEAIQNRGEGLVQGQIQRHR